MSVWLVAVVDCNVEGAMIWQKSPHEEVDLFSFSTDSPSSPCCRKVSFVCYYWALCENYQHVINVFTVSFNLRTITTTIIANSFELGTFLCSNLFEEFVSGTSRKVLFLQVFDYLT